MPSRANRSSNYLHTNRGRTNRDNAGQNAMILFTTLARLDSSIEKDILIWEMENSKEEDKLFICRIRKTLQKYNLPSPEEILENPQQWKNEMKKAINSFWYDIWTNKIYIRISRNSAKSNRNST
jgi:hypothetical protein